MNKILTIVAATLLSGVASAQMSYPITWEENPKIHVLDDSFKKQSAVYILNQRRLEYKEGADQNYYVYRTSHTIIKLVDEKGIEAFNKFTIPIGESRKIVSIKARTILPDGRINVLSQDKIRQTKSEEGVAQYLFAMEGVEKGAEVEVLYTEKRPISLFGSEIFQMHVPIIKSDFALIVPERFKFETKAYNGFPALKDSMKSDTRFYYASQKNTPALEEEEYSTYQSYLQRIDYKISYLLGGAHETVRLYTWTELARDLYTKYYSCTEKELKIADQYLQKIGVSETDDEVSKVRKIEEQFKSNITISDAIPDESYEAFSKIVEKKLTTEHGYLRFFTACLTQAGVKHELGLSSSRYEHPLDEDFELWSELDQYVIYLPKEKQYLAPSAVNYRYPFIPYSLFNVKGLFCKATTIGTMSSALPDMRVIPALPIGKSTNSIDAKITFNPSDMTPIIDIVHGFSGYTAVGVRGAFIYAPKDKEKEMIKNIIGIAAKEDDIKTYKIDNSPFDNYYENKPLLLSANVQSPQLMEKAGPKYLFKVGDVIGRQSELYNENKRVMPIDVAYSHDFVRTINITIPTGYKISNPDAVRFHVKQMGDEGKPGTGFDSDYTMEGNEMKIKIREYYDQLHFPVSGYEDFRKTVNAAADFNKVVLVLQKV